MLLPFLVIGLAAISCGGTLVDGSSEAPLAASALSGTWDLTATPSAASSTTGTLVLERSHVELTVGENTLELRGAGDAMTLTSRSASGVHVIDLSRASAPLDTGAFPLDVGGTWALTGTGRGAGERCDAQLGAGGLAASCTYVDAAWWHVAIRGSLVGTRVSTLASSFGDLGGVWHLSQGAASCDATFHGNDFKVSCASAGTLTGSFTAHVTDTLASGTTGTGGEFAARRRHQG